jgi:hypothetical protein
MIKLRKLWFRRKAVSSMIGGIIFLVIFLAALVFMLVIGQQYDVYQTTAAAMQQKQIEMYSENLLAAYPGIANGGGNATPAPPASPTRFEVNCAGGKCNNYTLVLNNLGINSRITRIYISSDAVCESCVIDPSKNPAPNHFLALDASVNAGESSHYVVFWLPTIDDLSNCSNDSECRVSIVTARGRVFSFDWPFPTIQEETGARGGGTGIYIGPLVITFQKELITYTTSNLKKPPIPLGGTNGYWVLPKVSSGGIIIYIKVQTDVNVTHDVYLTPQTVFEIVQFSSPGAVNQFFTVAPITGGTKGFCQAFRNATSYNKDIDCNLSVYTGAGPHTPNGDPKNIVPYSACGASPLMYNTTCQGRYIIPKPNSTQIQNHEKGTPVIVAFAVSKASGDKSNLQNIQWSSVSVTSFLGLSYVYDNGHGPYLYGVTLPFITLCIGDTGNPPTWCSR